MDITKIDLRSYRKNLSLVSQESSFYEGTILENITLSVPENEASDTAVKQACEAAQIHDFIVSLPDGT
jgi:ATP-binding cassette, subfamily B (MDR/TAP), member 1